MWSAADAGNGPRHGSITCTCIRQGSGWLIEALHNDETGGIAESRGRSGRTDHPMSNTARAVRSSLVVVALTLTGFNGIVEGLNAIHFADTPGMKVATATQLLYGFSAAAALVRCYRAGHRLAAVGLATGRTCPYLISKI